LTDGQRWRHAHRGPVGVLDQHTAFGQFLTQFPTGAQCRVDVDPGPQADTACGDHPVADQLLQPTSEHRAKVSGVLQVGAFRQHPQDRKSTRLNSSHVSISYAVFCLKKKKNTLEHTSKLEHTQYSASHSSHVLLKRSF